MDKDPKLAVAISREIAITGRINKIPFVFCFKNSEIIYDYPLTFLMNIKFTYQNHFNEFIQRADASGLIDKWRRISKTRTIYSNIEKEYGTLKMESFQLLFIVIVPISLLLFLLLLFERIVHRKAQNQNSFHIWKIIEMSIDPYRHFWRKNKCFWK